MQARFEMPFDMTANTLLDERIPLRISVQTAKGPLIAPLWFEWDGARFWCACQKDAAIVRALEREQLCAFDLSTNEMPYRGLRGRGHAHCRPERGVAVLERLIDRYLPDRRSPACSVAVVAQRERSRDRNHADVADDLGLLGAYVRPGLTTGRLARPEVQRCDSGSPSEDGGVSRR